MVHNSKTPVLLLRPKETDAGTDRTPGAGQILVPLDGSPIAEAALEPAAALAQALGTEITMIQMVTPVQLPENVAFPFPSAYDEEITALERRQAQDYLDDEIEELQATGIRASGVAVIGWNTAQRIMDTARADQIAFIALATHGRSGLGRLALGSVADKLVRGAEVPVLVCHPSGRGKIDKASRPGFGSRGRRARKGR
jgi:nucleotide-binding universal stress UspA family protein